VLDDVPNSLCSVACSGYCVGERVRARPGHSCGVRRIQPRRVRGGARAARPRRRVAPGALLARPTPHSWSRRCRDYLAPDFFAHQSAEPLEVIEQGDRVLVVARARARGRESGVAIDQTIFHVWTVSGGRAKRFEAYVDRGEALAALTPPAGSPGSAFAGPPPGGGGLAAKRPYIGRIVTHPPFFGADERRSTAAQAHNRGRRHLRTPPYRGHAVGNDDGPRLTI
jgi:hypothetical protein